MPYQMSGRRKGNGKNFWPLDSCSTLTSNEIVLEGMSMVDCMELGACHDWTCPHPRLHLSLPAVHSALVLDLGRELSIGQFKAINDY